MRRRGEKQRARQRGGQDGIDVHPGSMGDPWNQCPVPVMMSTVSEVTRGIDTLMRQRE
jgi:hypothetical protein